MSADSRRAELLALLERVHVCANDLKNQVIALHQTIRFDHQSPGAQAAAGRIERELGELSDDLRQFHELFDPEGRRGG